MIKLKMVPSQRPKKFCPAMSLVKARPSEPALQSTVLEIAEEKLTYQPN